jgi:hypothetical protein
LQALAEVLTNGGRSCGDGVGELQHQLFITVEEIALVPEIQVAQLFIADSRPPPRGRVDVNSKRALNQLGGANLAKDFEFGWDQIGLIQSHGIARIRDEHSGMSFQSLERSNDFSQALFGEALDQANFESFEHAHSLFSAARPSCP